MEKDQLKIHGSIFILLKKFIDNSFLYNTWNEFLKRLGVEAVEFDINRSYPIELFHSLVHESAQLKQVSENKLIEEFGEFLVPDLLIFYAAYLKPQWKTLELLEHTEAVMHQAVRKINPDADPPKLHVSRVNERLLIIDYYSKRKLSGLAIGIIRGIAVFYGEDKRIAILPTSAFDDERVQIRVEFD